MAHPWLLQNSYVRSCSRKELLQAQENGKRFLDTINNKAPRRQDLVISWCIIWSCIFMLFFKCIFAYFSRATCIFRRYAHLLPQSHDTYKRHLSWCAALICSWLHGSLSHSPQTRGETAQLLAIAKLRSSDCSNRGCQCLIDPSSTLNAMWLCWGMDFKKSCHRNGDSFQVETKQQNS